jgi:hypothetical protein
VRLKGLGTLKNEMTSLGIEPATFQLVAQCPMQLRYSVTPQSASHLRSDGYHLLRYETV